MARVFEGLRVKPSSVTTVVTVSENILMLFRNESGPENARSSA